MTKSGGNREIQTLKNDETTTDDLIVIHSSPITPPAQNLRCDDPAAVPVPAACPGYNLELQEKVSPFESYPFLLHTKYTLPWTVTIDSEYIILRSTKCSGTEGTSLKGKTSKPLACYSCTRLHDNTIVMGIRHRLLDGAHEKSPWAFLTSREMYAMLKQKTQQANNYKLRALNNATSIAIRNRNIRNWKRLAMAIGQSDIPRIRALMSTQVCREITAQISVITNYITATSWLECSYDT